jgi:predicted Zn-dependent peptidase
MFPMKRTQFVRRPAAMVLAFLALAGGALALNYPVEYHKLPNGLRVVLSRDTTAPIATVAVYYRIGFRIEPRDRTGFAHLFEHMMFQGSANLGKMEFIRLVESRGGILNGSTRFDFTNYFEIVPAHVLETMLWAEADRMRGLAITDENLKNQQGVVTNEVKVNVLNQPYGGFPWLDLPQAANKNWYNAHNFYGDLKDIEAATLKDVQAFFKTFYAPNNAALVVTGDFEPAETLALIKKYFGDIPAAKLPPPPDLKEPRQEKGIHKERVDPLAQKPALAFGYHAPDRGTPEYFALGIIDGILLQGEDSWLHQKLVQEKGITDAVTGGINSDLGNMFNYDGPMLWSASLIHDAAVKPDEILALIDGEIEKLRTKAVEKAVLDRTLIKFRSGFYDMLGGFFGFGRADLLACFALFDDKPDKINGLEDDFKKVTPELILNTAKEYLRPANRTVFVLKTKAQGK